MGVRSTEASVSPDPLSILIAEDSQTQAARLRHILEAGGYRVAVAESGRVALDMLRESRPSLVISDVVMPEVDGYELSRRCRWRSPSTANNT